MSRIWRITAPVAIAGGLITAGIMPAQAASPATYSVTISATSPHYGGAKHGLVDGYALVTYKTTKNNVNTAVISGTVTGALSGDTATLLQKPFGTTTFKPAPATPVTLTGPTSQPYTFNVTPSLATEYEVQVTTATTIDKTSGIKTVYVTEGGHAPPAHQKCNAAGTICTFTYWQYTVLPSSAYKTEAKKRLSLYDVVVYGPKQPKYWDLVKSASAGKARKVHADEFKRFITFHVKFRNSRWGWGSLSCSKDNEKVDGMGLPRSTGCGAKRLSIKIVYAG